MIKNSMDVMLDLETMGTSPGCIILSIGASTFDQSMQFYEKIWVSDSELHNFFSDPATRAWWAEQDQKTYTEATSGIKSIITVLGEFSDWFRKIPAANVYIWGNGADFDIPILKEYYETMKMPIPWKPFNGRCYRTLKNLYPQIKAHRMQGMKHNALEDARSQAIHAVEILIQHFRRE